MDELTFLPAQEMAARIRRHEISPRELVAAHLDRVDRLNPRLNAIIYLDREGAMRAAEATERALKAGDRTGPLHGVPITVKSSIDVRGWPAESGSCLRAGRVAEQDALLVARLRKAGAILLGSTNTPELLMAYETANSLYGRTNNPWDLNRTPGGSSGGEAAAIAAGMSAAGVGSDGGGSIRIPAHYSGICGLKPTPGRIPATGHFPASTGPFALIGVVGPMARTVGDLEVMFTAMSGPDIGDPSSAPVPVRPCKEEEIRRMKIGWFDEDDSVPVTPETRAAVRSVAERLRDAGYLVTPFKPLERAGAGGLKRVRELWWNIFVRAGAMMIERDAFGRRAELSTILQEFLGIAAESPALTTDELLDTWIERDLLRGRLLAEMEDVPLFICPVCSIPAFRHGEREWRIGGVKVKYLDAMSYTQWFNILGNPVAVIPAGESPEGLPVGVQVVGRPYEEETVLAVARTIERLAGHQRKPPLE